MRVAAEAVVESIKEELDQQGHRASGKLIESIEAKVKNDFDSILSGEVFMEEYGQYLDKRIPPQRIKYNPLWLLPWAKRVKPGLSDQELRSFVFAVWSKHKKEGMPTRGSYAYSKNGRRTEWSKHAVEKKEDYFGELLKLERFFSTYIEESLENVEIR